MERGGQRAGGWLTAERHEGKREKGVTIPPHAAHMDTAVLCQKGHPGVLWPHKKLAGPGGLPRIVVLLLIPAVLQDRATSQGQCLRHHKPLAEIQLSISASSGEAVTDSFTSPYTNLPGNLQGFSCPDYS